MVGKIRTLLIDDSPSASLNVSRALRGDLRFEIVGRCLNGREGLVSTLRLKPVLIFLDIEMPVMDGVTYLRLVRKKTDAKIVVLSALVGRKADVGEKAKMLGANAVMPKLDECGGGEEAFNRNILRLVQSFFPGRSARSAA
ncbi:MAG: response regulator [Nannocystaceae bacterium]